MCSLCAVVIKKTAGDHVREWRERDKLTKRAAAIKLGVTPTHVYYLETGRRYASPMVATMLAKLTGQPVTLFLNMRPR